MRHNEDNLQIACMDYTRLQYPSVLSIHIPNGGYRNMIEAKRFKRMGVTRGMPDVMIFEPNHGYVGLAVELKVGSNASTDEQLLAQVRLAQVGWLVATDVRTLIAYREIIDSYLK